MYFAACKKKQAVLSVPLQILPFLKKYTALSKELWSVPLAHFIK